MSLDTPRSAVPLSPAEHTKTKTMKLKTNEQTVTAWLLAQANNLATLTGEPYAVLRVQAHADGTVTWNAYIDGCIRSIDGKQCSEVIAAMVAHSSPAQKAEDMISEAARLNEQARRLENKAEKLRASLSGPPLL